MLSILGRLHTIQWLCPIFLFSLDNDYALYDGILSTATACRKKLWASTCLPSDGSCQPGPARYKARADTPFVGTLVATQRTFIAQAPCTSHLFWGLALRIRQPTQSRSCSSKEWHCAGRVSFGVIAVVPCREIVSAASDFRQRILGANGSHISRQSGCVWMARRRKTKWRK